MTEDEMLEQEAARQELEGTPQGPDPVEAPAAPTEDPRLTAALEQQRKQRQTADLLRAFQQVLQGAAPNSGFKADPTMANSLERRAEEPVEQYKAKLGQEAAAKKENREQKTFETQQKESQLRQDDFQLKLAKSKLDFQDMQANSDPTSPQSKIAQDRVIEQQKKMGQPVNEQQIRAQSGKQLYQYFDYLKEDLTNFYKNENSRLDREQKASHDKNTLDMMKERNIREDAKQKMYDEDRDANRDLRKETREQNKELKLSAKLDKDVEAVSKRFEKEAIPQREAAMNEINAFLMKQGVDVDVPETHNKASIQGMGVGGQLRPDFLTSNSAIDFRQNVQSLANQLLKTRSGAAVTDQEYARFLKEAGSGNFSNEANLMSGLRKMKRDIKLQRDNILKTASPEAQAEFAKRMGEEPPTSEKKQAVGPYGETTKAMGPDGKEHTMKWNPQVNKYQPID